MKRKLVLVCLSFVAIIHAIAEKSNDRKGCSEGKRKFSSQYVEPLSTEMKVKEHRTDNDQFVLDHFFQNLPAETGGRDYWHVTRLGTILYSRYYSLNLTVDQADYVGAQDRFLSSDLSYRFGVEIDQSFVNNDSLYFRFMLATGNFFPGSLFNSGYSWQAGHAGRLCIDVYGMGFNQDDLYFLIAPAFSRRVSSHELTVKPYYSASRRGRLNLSVSDRISIGTGSSFLLFELVSGYLPNRDTFVEYQHFDDQRYRFSCEGGFYIAGEQVKLLPGFGMEFTNHNRMKINWYMQMGIQCNL